MLDERELSDVLRAGLERDVTNETQPELRDAEVSEWPSDNAGFLVKLLDGSLYSVTVTQLQSGD
jgi:hypothetical protein